MTKVITREAQKRGIINRKQSLTKSKLVLFAEKLNLTGREKLSINRQKHLSGQSDKTLEMLFKKLNYKPNGEMEKALELSLKMGKVTGSVRRVEIITFDALVEFGAKANYDLNELKDWNFGLKGNNTIVNQKNIPFKSTPKNLGGRND